MDDYKIYLNEDKTKAVTIWKNGEITYSERETSDDVWSPPIRLEEEKRD